MSLIPGYDFAEQEYVVPERLLQWMLGTQIYPAQSQSAQDGGLPLDVTASGLTSVSLSQEGQLFFDLQTGHLCIQSRWGQIPVLCGDAIFTRRFRSNARSYGETAYPGHAFGLACVCGTMPGTPASTPSCSQAAFETAWEQNTILNVQGRGTYEAYNTIFSPAIIWPSLDSPMSTSQLTEATQTGEQRRLLCVRGWTPVFIQPWVATYESSATCVQASVASYNMIWIVAGGVSSAPLPNAVAIRGNRSWNMAHDYWRTYMWYIRMQGGAAASAPHNNTAPSWTL